MSKKINTEDQSKSINENHDHRDKELFEAFFEDFIHVCFPNLVNKLDFSKKQLLQQEFPLSKTVSQKTKTTTRKVDMLIDVPFKKELLEEAPLAYELFIDNEEDLLNGVHTTKATETKTQKIGRPSKSIANEASLKYVHESAKFLIHLELERSSNPFQMSKRMWEYQQLIVKQYTDAMVLPIVVFFVNEISGMKWSVFKKIVCDEEIISFRYFRIGLKKESATYWLKQNYPLMFALSMHMQYDQKERAELKLSILKKIAESEISEFQKIILDDYIQQSLELTLEEEEHFKKLFQQEPPMVRKYLTAVDRYIEGKAEGEAKGKAEGLVNAINMILQNQGKSINHTQQSLLTQVQDIALLNEILKNALNPNTTIEQLLKIAQNHQ